MDFGHQNLMFVKTCPKFCDTSPSCHPVKRANSAWVHILDEKVEVLPGPPGENI